MQFMPTPHVTRNFRFRLKKQKQTYLLESNAAQIFTSAKYELAFC